MSPDSGNSKDLQLPRKSLRQRFFRTRADDQLPLTITHERIYILPSRRGWWFIASLLVMLVASINYSLSLGYALCFLLTGLFTATLLATYRNLSGLTVVAASVNETHAGDYLRWRLSLAVTNERFGIDLTGCGATTRCDLMANAMPSAGAPIPNIIEHRVEAPRRGWHPLGRLTLSSDYPLGLWYTWCYLHSAEAALVLPAVADDPIRWPEVARCTLDDHPAQSDLVTAAAGRSVNCGETVGLRIYREGDSLASVAWKNAARGQGLHVREWALPTAPATLAFDWQMSASAGDTEARVSLLASWIRLAQRTQLQWSLDLPGVTLPVSSGKAHLSDSMRALALFNPDAADA